MVGKWPPPAIRTLIQRIHRRGGAFYLNKRRVLPEQEKIGERVMEQERLRRLFVLATVISGVAAAYLMYRRGESLGAIAKKTLANPLGALASEVRGAVETQPPGAVIGR
jgi:hypothetical protein